MRFTVTTEKPGPLAIHELLEAPCQCTLGPDASHRGASGRVCAGALSASGRGGAADGAGARCAVNWCLQMSLVGNRFSFQETLDLKRASLSFAIDCHWGNIMCRIAAVILIALLLFGGSVAAFDAEGTLKKIDAANGTLMVQANGQERNVKVAQDVKILDAAGAALAGGLKAKELHEGAGATFTIERQQGQPVVTIIQLGRKNAGSGQPLGGRDSVGLKPLTEMTAEDDYKGEDGGLYGGGHNEPPASHQIAAKTETEKVKPLNADGQSATTGLIGFVSISMSNATQEFSYFKQIADKDSLKSPNVVIVDCAQGGQAMAQWVDPNARAWIEADRRLTAAKVSPNQVQVAWIKLANVAPSGELTAHGKKLQRDTLSVLHNAKARFPNLRIVYLGSRIYGGYSTGPLNPEPYAYEGAFAVRWLIQDQMKGDAELNFDPARGTVKTPLLLWGPYLWADGVTPRKSDGLVWERKDLAADGTHPSQSGREKVAKMLLNFFQTDANAATWFVKQ